MSSDADTLTLALSFVTIDGKETGRRTQDNPKRVAIEHPSPYSQMEVLPEGYSRRDSGSKNKPIIIDSDSDSDSETPVTFRQDYFSWGPFLKKKYHPRRLQGRWAVRALRLAQQHHSHRPRIKSSQTST